MIVCSMIGMLLYMNSKTGLNPMLAERQAGGEALSLGQMEAQEAFGGNLFEQDGLGGDISAIDEKDNSIKQLVHRPSDDTNASPIGSNGMPPGTGGAVGASSFNVGSPVSVDILEIDAALNEPMASDGHGILSQIAATKKLLAEAQAELEALRSSSADLAGVLPRASPVRLTKARRAKAQPVTFLKTHKVRNEEKKKVNGRRKTRPRARTLKIQPGTPFALSARLYC